jgi:hypothetical protein
MVILGFPIFYSFFVVSAAILTSIPFYFIISQFHKRVQIKYIFLLGILIASSCYYPIFNELSNTGYQWNSADEFGNQTTLIKLAFVYLLSIPLFIAHVLVYPSSGQIVSRLVKTEIRFSTISFPSHIGSGIYC